MVFVLVITSAMTNKPEFRLLRLAIGEANTWEVIGFEPTTSWLQTRRLCRTELHPQYVVLGTS